jgi:N-acetylmuramoyl-L-alanine amidase
MHVLVAFILAWACLSDVHAVQQLKHRPGSVPSSAGEYVPLREWAEANRFHVTELKKDEEVRLTNRWNRLIFKVNSQRVEVDDITLFFSYPVLLHQSAVSIAQKDIDRCLRPILFPTKNDPKHVIKTIAVSAGHGGKDCGYQFGSYKEKNYTLLLAHELQKAAKQAGFKTVMVRDSDLFVDLEDRPRIAKRGKADVFVELHYNCAGPGNMESRGVEVYCLTPSGASSTNGGTDSYGPLPGNRNDERNVLLAYQIHSALVENASLADRGVRRARFVVLRDAEMPAVLVEAGFMSQPDEMRWIQDPVHRRQTAQAVLDGLLAYKRLVEK